ncbi:MAG: calcium-binding EGF-like domain-containing protein [Chitinophagales bacterium]|nr:calcium-binding EGF-like domain-containing protein [Chitinophagales bacterium]
MKLLKNFIFPGLLTLFAFSLVLYASCNNKCKDITCQNGGTCENGSCKCPTGYEGEFCETASDPCSNIDCLNGGTCDNGKCNCPDGYEGDKCEIAINDRYTGIWTVFEDGTLTNAAQYEISVTSGSPTTIKVSNFYNRFMSNMVNINIDGNNMTIPQQDINGYIIEGNGTLEWDNIDPSHGKVTLRYKVKEPSGGINDFGLENGSASTWNR